jgi:hypothetical protein
MLTQLKKYFTNLFDAQGQTTYGSELEQFIVSKHPQSTYDVEYWTAQFDKKQNEKGWIL